MSKKQTTDTEQEAFLSRWSRLKTEHTEQELVKSESDEALSDTAMDTQSDEESQVLTDEDMPPIESLDENSDYSLFMSKGVKTCVEWLFASSFRRVFSIFVMVWTIMMTISLHLSL